MNNLNDCCFVLILWLVMKRVKYLDGKVDTFAHTYIRIY